MTVIKEVLSHTTVLSIILVGLQSILLPMVKGRWPIFILPMVTLVIGNGMIWSNNDAQNKVMGTVVVIVLAGLLLLRGLVSKSRRTGNH
ncbi:hypothetical protein HAU32_00535 [Weissella confusa]|uniref:Uncharacterized protein n=1 Tax=Weissella fermenti TaxID=2987699 RepID=A0ABT6D382_9LACO|nr:MULTISPECIES: hypothetical protein [Weissella]MBJ7687493.1 hypothetical protein [Weissella confusa]MCW0927510.1 hypothetical protein [Weissella sp. LMG 11983]MDF9299965.1 hypothetical protein [Weissella sp. BK2]